MVGRICATLFVLGIVPASVAPATEAGKPESRTLEGVFLYADSQDRVWMGHPLVGLGMIGVMDTPPFRLSPALEERFRPLLTSVEQSSRQGRRDAHDYWWWGLPSVRDRRSPLILLRLEAIVRPRTSGQHRGMAADSEGDRAPSAHPPDRPEYFEVTSARLMGAEFISQPWRDAWKSLDQGLREIVRLSRTAPGEEKKRHLADAIEQCSRALGRMVKCPVSDESRAIVDRIEPKARVVRLFQRRIEHTWGDELGRYVDRLKLVPRTPLPGRSKPCPKVRLLAESSSADRLIDTIQRSWPEATLDERLIYSEALRRTVFVWEVEHLTPAEFDTLRSEAQEQLKRLGDGAGNEPPGKPPKQSGRTMPEWGVVLCPAGEELLAEKLLLRGTSVKEVLNGGSPIGLRQGDVIIDYGNVYDLVMERVVPPIRTIGNVIRSGGKLTVLRNDRVVTITVNSQ